MPCDSGPSFRDYGELQAELDRVTRLLCAVVDSVKELPAPLDGQFRAWLTEHQGIDQQRVRREREARRRIVVRAAALAKLTDEEREALHLRLG